MGCVKQTRSSNFVYFDAIFHDTEGKKEKEEGVAT
jgi:hypothetical protein